MSAPATYGDLMPRAAMGITGGVMWVQNFPAERKEFANRAIDDFRDALRALAEHTRVLLDQRRLAGITASGAPDPRERAAVALGETAVRGRRHRAAVAEGHRPTQRVTVGRCGQVRARGQ